MRRALLGLALVLVIAGSAGAWPFLIGSSGGSGGTGSGGNWSSSGNNSIQTTGNVGIGTSAPTSTLDVAGTINATGGITLYGTQTSTNTAVWDVQNSSGTILRTQVAGASVSTATYANTPGFIVNISTPINYFFNSSTQPAVAISSGGVQTYMAINSSNTPTFDLSSTQGYWQMKSSSTSGNYMKASVGNTVGFEFGAAGGQAVLWNRSTASGGQIIIFSSSTNKNTVMNTDTFGNFTITSSSGVRIGTSTTQAGLNNILVTGTVFSLGQAMNVPDYALEFGLTGKLAIFAKQAESAGYTGMIPLANLRKELSKTYTLPGFKSQAEVTADGKVDVPAEVRKQQEALEHAYVYIIQLHERIEALERKYK